MKSRKKHIAAVAAVSAMLFLTPLVVFALMLKSAERVNTFHPSEQNVVIAENMNKPFEAQENEMKWSETINSAGNHVADKVVEVGEISDPNGEYLRVYLVPTWYDISGCVVSGVENVTDISSAQVAGDTLVFKGSGGNDTRVTVNLAENWDDAWKPVPNENDVQYFETKQLVKAGDERIKLVSSVEISDTILQTANESNIFLRLDVIADSVQTVENNVNPRW